MLLFSGAKAKPNATLPAISSPATPPKCGDGLGSVDHRTDGKKSLWALQNAVMVSTIPPPTNFVSVSKGSRPIQRNWAIDVWMYVNRYGLPDGSHPLLPELRWQEGETEETRRNLHLECKDADIEADIWIVGYQPHHEMEIWRPCIIYAVNGTGNTTLNLRDLLNPNQAAAQTSRPPLQLIVSSDTGSVDLRLPRSFRGTITATANHGTVWISPLLERSINRAAGEDIKESPEAARYRVFVGEIRAKGRLPDVPAQTLFPFPGMPSDPTAPSRHVAVHYPIDTVQVTVRMGDIRVRYVDDEDPDSDSDQESEHSDESSSTKKKGVIDGTFTMAWEQVVRSGGQGRWEFNLEQEDLEDVPEPFQIVAAMPVAHRPQGSLSERIGSLPLGSMPNRFEGIQTDVQVKNSLMAQF